MSKHPYILAMLLSTILSVVVWFYVPKEYAAVTKLSDEYKETDLAVGLNQLSSGMKQAAGLDNANMNDIEVYCKVLKTTDFARFISKQQVPGKQISYAEWVMGESHFWQTKDTVEAVLDNIEYNINTQHQTLTISFIDRDALVAAQMLDSVTQHLQEIVTASRHNDTDVQVEHQKRNCEKLADEYHKAQESYASFCDSHRYLSEPEQIKHKDKLKQELDIAHGLYTKAYEQYARQIALNHKDYTSFTVVKSNSVPKETTSHFVVYFIAILFLVLALTKASKLLMQRVRERATLEFGGLFSPWVITIVVWGVMAIMFVISGDILDPLTDQFYTAIALWIPIFVITSFATFNLLRHDSKSLPDEGIEMNKMIFYFFFLLAVVLSPMYIYKVYQIVSMFDTKDMMSNMRLLAVHGEGQGYLTYSVVIAQSLLLVAFWRYPRIPLWQIVVIVICCVLGSLAIMEKGGVFFTVLCGLYVLFERKVIRKRTIVIVGCLTLLSFYCFNLVRQGTESDYAKNESLIDFIGMYVMSPPVAFCTVSKEITNQPGVNTFEVVYDYLQRFGIGHYEVHEKLQEFVFVPISTNVYTVLQPFYRDFGYIGVAFFAWIYGIITGAVYRFSKNGNAYCICLYTYLVELLVLQFYQENLFLTLSFNIQLCFLLACYLSSKISFSFSTDK